MARLVVRAAHRTCRGSAAGREPRRRLAGAVVAAPGLTSLGPPRLAAAAQIALGRAKKHLAEDAYQSQPAWLRLLPRIGATGQVWQMRDVYGARFAVIAGFSYPDDTDRSVFLFDIDACGLVNLVRAGVFDDEEEAAASWRATVGRRLSTPLSPRSRRPISCPAWSTARPGRT